MATRRDRKEEARRQREAALRRMRRRRTARRAAIWAGLAIAAALVVFFFLNRSRESEALVDRAERVADRAGCSQVEERPDLGRSHQPPYNYEALPATSGPHDPAPLPPEPHVYNTPVPEPQAVHNLEHGYVLIYYRKSGTEKSLPQDVVEALEELAEGEEKVIMAPYPKLLPGTALALAAWNRIQECPAGVEAGDATLLARAFISQFRGGGEAPEPFGA